MTMLVFKQFLDMDTWNLPMYGTYTTIEGLCCFARLSVYMLLVAFLIGSEALFMWRNAIYS